MEFLKKHARAALFIALWVAMFAFIGYVTLNAPH